MTFVAMVLCVVTCAIELHSGRVFRLVHRALGRNDSTVAQIKHRATAEGHATFL